MPTAKEILKQYWGFDEFREPQEAIINSVMEGKDTFGLMPTGGGKSICFQIPAMLMNGICLVISPLVALMKDQVENLQKRNIKAIALTGGINFNETSDLLDNCLYGNYKFLYVSPERLQNDWILERIQKLPINLVAIDEAHCVSQWGHDFRPAYLKISVLKDFFTKTPFLALTASATPQVKEDIILQLKLENPSLFEKSFARENIAYMVFEIEDKLFRMEQIFKKNPQSSIVYVRNRKSCLDVASQLETLGIKATFYHGGLSTKEKTKNMNLWMQEEVQVIVATNAFGMGIDKANVKTVIHIQLPENIENYYQEAGRAGRNGEKAFAVLLLSPSDIIYFENQLSNVLLDAEFLKNVYIKICNYFQIAYGEGINEQFEFNLNHFCVKYNFPLIKTFNAMQFLDRQGIFSLSQEFTEKISLQFIISSKELIRYTSLNPHDEDIILNLLRTYPGIYEVQTPINSSLIAKKAKVSETQLHDVLKKLNEKGVIEYHAKNNDASIIFNDVREDEKTINKVLKFLDKQNKLKQKHYQSVVDYISDKKTCKSKLILSYFGEKSTKNCGICSNCISKNIDNKNLKNLSKLIVQLLQKNDLDSREIQKISKSTADEIIFAIQSLLEAKKIILKSNNKYSIAN